MGKIAQYQSRQLASSAVGVPQLDQSGEMIAAGVGKAVQTAASLYGERQQKANDLASDVHLSDFSIAYGEAKGKAMLLYRDTPDKLPEAVRDHGTQLVENFASKLQPGVAEDFKNKASKFVTNDTLNSITWARQRDQEIIVGNIEKGYVNLEMAAQNAMTPEALKGVLAEVDKHSAKSQAFISFSSDNAIKERTKKAIKENAMSGRILTDAQDAYGSLMKGAYKDILTPAEEKQYAKMAQNAAIYDATLNQYRSLTTAGAQISEMSDRLQSGDLPISEINLQLEWAKTHANDTDVNGDRMVPESYIDGLETLRDLKLKQDFRTPDQRRADATEFEKIWQTEWDKYLFEKPDKKANVKDYNNVIGMYAKALKANQSGIISDARFAAIRRIMDTQLKSRIPGAKATSAGITEALNNAASKRLGPWSSWTNPKENIYSAGYAQIGEYFKKVQGLSVVDRQMQTEDLLIKYTETLDNMPQEQRDKIQNANKAASDILNGYSRDGKMSPGLFDRLTVISNSETGEIYHKNQIIQRNGGSFIVTGKDPVTGGPLFKPVKVK
jgi:hypothetical protein